MTHKEVKEKTNGQVIDRDLVKEAVEGNHSTLEIVLKIKYQGIYAYEIYASLRWTNHSQSRQAMQ